MMQPRWYPPDPDPTPPAPMWLRIAVFALAVGLLALAGRTLVVAL